jgi:hypothetical protein
MSPHGIIFYGAMALGLVGKLAFQSTIRVGIFAAVALPFVLALYFGDISPIAVVLIAPLSLVGAAIGVGVGWLCRETWVSRRR